MRPLLALAALAFAPAAHAEPKRAPTHRAAVVVVSELPPSQRAHTKWWYERAAERCERRATEWARRRCLAEVAQR